METFHRFLILLAGIFLFGIGVLLGLLELIAIIDPVGTKMADDSDPFGDPHIPWYVHTIYILITISCFFLSWLLFRSIEKTK